MILFYSGDTPPETIDRPVTATENEHDADVRRASIARALEPVRSGLFRALLDLFRGNRSELAQIAHDPRLLRDIGVRPEDVRPSLGQHLGSSVPTLARPRGWF